MKKSLQLVQQLTHFGKFILDGGENTVKQSNVNSERKFLLKIFQFNNGMLMN